MKTVEVYGVTLTTMQEMKFHKYLQNNRNSIPAMNTMTKEERRQIVINWILLTLKNKLK